MTFATPTSLSATVLTGSSPFVSPATYAFANDTFYMLDVTTKAASGSTKPTGISGGGITWTFINEATSSTMNTSCWYGFPASGATTTALTFTCAAAITEIAFTLSSTTGVDTTTPIIQSQTGSKSSSTTFGSPDLTPLAPLGSVTNMTHSAVAHQSNPNETTTSSNMTRINEIQPNGSNRNLASFYSISNVINPTHAANTAGNWRGVSYEIKESLVDPGDPGGGGGGGGGVIVTGGDVKLGLWVGGDASGSPFPNGDNEQYGWLAGVDPAWKPTPGWAGGTGISRDSDVVRFRGGYGTGPWTQMLKDTGSADYHYMVNRGIALSSNMKFTQIDPDNNLDPPNVPLRATINGQHDQWLTQQANAIKALDPIQVYIEIFSEANVASSSSQPPSPDGPWTEDFTHKNRVGTTYRYYGGDSPHAFQLTGIGGNGSISATSKNTFRDHFKYIVDFFDARGVTNVRWVLSLAGKTSSVWGAGGTSDRNIFITPLLALNRPGVGVGGYIDCVGVDAYSKTGKAGDPGVGDWDDCFEQALTYAQSVSKPLGIFETGQAPDPNATNTTATGCSTSFTSKATWYTQGAEWIDYHRDDLEIVVFNVGPGERYDPMNDQGRTVNQASWTAFKAMANSTAFTDNTSTVTFANTSTTSNAGWAGFVRPIGTFASSSTTTDSFTGQKAESMLDRSFASSSTTTQAGWAGVVSGVVGNVNVHVSGARGSQSPLEVFLGMELR